MTRINNKIDNSLWIAKKKLDKEFNSSESIEVNEILCEIGNLIKTPNQKKVTMLLLLRKLFQIEINLFPKKKKFQH